MSQMEERELARCPGCNRKVKGDGSDDDAVSCDGPANSDKNHWWHRDCLEADSHLATKKVPIKASLITSLHNKKFSFVCHICDMTQPPLPVQLVVQGVVTREDLIKSGGMTQEIEQYLCEYRAGNIKPGALPAVSFMKDQAPPVSESSATSSTSTDVYHDESQALVRPEASNTLHIQQLDEIDPDKNPKPDGGDESLNAVVTTTTTPLIPAGPIPSFAGGGALTTTTMAGPPIPHPGGTGLYGYQPVAGGGIPPNVMALPHQYPPPATYNPSVMPPQYAAPIPFTDPQSFLGVIMKQQTDLFERLDRQRRDEEEQRRRETEDREEQRRRETEAREDQRRREAEAREEQRRQEMEAREKENREFMERILRGQQVLPSSSSQPHLSTSQPVMGFAKPKFELPHFGGDILEWTSYWDTFTQGVHNNPKFTTIEKLQLLVGSLRGRAKKAVENYKLEERNYQSVIDVLKDRFHDTIKVKTAHLQSLMNLSPVHSPHPAQLQTFLDSVDLHARALISLEDGGEGVVDGQCITIVPCLFEKLPVIIRSQIFEHGGNEVRSKLSCFRASLKSRVKVQESIYGSSWLTASGQSGSGPESSTPPPRKPPIKNLHASGSALLGPETTSHPSPPSGNKTPPYRKYCLFCQKHDEHRSFECHVYNTLESRKQKLGSVCFICLKRDHFVKDCPVKTTNRCYTCKKSNHHSNLCPELLKNLAQKSRKNPHTKPSGKKDPSQLTLEVSAGSAGDVDSGELGVCVPEDEEGDEDKILCEEDSEIAMQTAVVTVRNPTNHKQATANVLYDCGSKRTYISQKIASLMSLRAHKNRWRCITTFNAAKSRKVKAGITDLEVQGQDGLFIQLTGNIIDYIAGTVCMEGFLLSDLDKTTVKTLKMADYRFSEDREFEIDIVIGSDFYAMLLSQQKIQLHKSGVYLLETQLGWVTCGVIRESARLPHSETHSESEGLVLISGEAKPIILEEDSYSPLEDLWKFETLGIKDPKSSSINDHVALNQFNDTVKFENGRVSVTWLTKPGIEKLPSNFNIALNRLRATLRMLGKNKEHHEKYIKNFEDWLSRAITEIVTQANENPEFQKHYISHHAVFKYDSKTTKMRIVLDASAVTRLGKSLNDYLYRGPNFLSDLGGLLIRFRHYLIALISDIEKAFLQVLLQDSAKDLTRFLWLKDPTKLTVDNNLQIYRFQRVPFGFKTSPFFLAASIWTLLDQAKGSEVPIAENIRDNIYVDNVITGVQSVSEAQEFYTVAKKLFAQGSMNLREWNSNSAHVMEAIPEHDRDERDTVKVLGMSWNKSKDTLSIAMKDISEFLQAHTKREILACLASIFDPLGLVSCLKIQGMIFLQELWRESLGWDDPLPESLINKWRPLCDTFKIIPEISIPRLLSQIVPSTQVSLLCFCDAGASAFSTTVYVRTDNENEEVKAGLVFSKARLCPASGTTVPRSELLGVFIGTKCANYVKRELGVNVVHTYLWTDSQCVLGWIQNEARDQGVFVTNRVTEILNYQDITFKYIPTEQNPADLCTKTRAPGFQIPWDLWFNGPAWLTLPIKDWPTFDTSLPAESVTLVARGSNRKNLKHQKNESTLNLESVFNLGLYGSRPFMDLVRVMAWVKRFVHNVREKVQLRKDQARIIQTRSKTQSQTPTAEKSVNNLQPLSREELKSAQNLWLESVQRQAYPDLFTQKIRASSFAQNLRLKLDEDNLLRSYGRFGESTLEEEAKYPILLPPKSEITKIIVSSYHKKHFHSGVNYTLSHIRSSFWIPQGRKVVATILKSCAHCKKFHSSPFAGPPMPNLPKERVSQSPPFSFTGCDYFGPLFHRSERGESKAWVVLFTCFSIRAVHLELVPDMTGETLLCALRRFVSRRGRPRIIYSDNAKQFKIMKKILKQTENNPLYDFVKAEGITWKFIPELSPWHGASWERMVGVTKDSLKKALGRTVLSFEQLRTVMVEIEDTVNSRPLTFVNMSEADDDMKILTPQMFLSTGRPERLPVLAGDDPQDPEYLPRQTTQSQIVKNWKQAQYYLDQFWELWKKHYLLSLRERHTSDKFPKIKSQVYRAPEIGEIVQVKSEGAPRGLWKLGRIVEVQAGRDSLIRSAKVKLAASKEPITRPVSLLFPLELRSSTQTSEIKVNKNLVACDPSFGILDHPSSPSGELEVHGHGPDASPWEPVRVSPCAQKSKSTVITSDSGIEKRENQDSGVRFGCGICFHRVTVLLLVALCCFPLGLTQNQSNKISSFPKRIQSPRSYKIHVKHRTMRFQMEDILLIGPLPDEELDPYAPVLSPTVKSPTPPPSPKHKSTKEPQKLKTVSSGRHPGLDLPVPLGNGYFEMKGRKYRKCDDCFRYIQTNQRLCGCRKKILREVHRKRENEKKREKGPSSPAPTHRSPLPVPYPSGSEGPGSHLPGRVIRPPLIVTMSSAATPPRYRVGLLPTPRELDICSTPGLGNQDTNG